MTDRRIGARAPMTALLALAAMWSVAGHAEQLLVVNGQVVHGSLALSNQFAVPGAGTLTVTLTDVKFPAPLSSLTFTATSPVGAVVASLASAGQTTFKVSSSGIYDSVVDAVASPQALLNLGQFSLTVDFVAAVPLPPAALLMSSGLAGLLLLAFAGRWGETLMMLKRYARPRAGRNVTARLEI